MSPLLGCGKNFESRFQQLNSELRRLFLYYHQSLFALIGIFLFLIVRFGIVLIYEVATITIGGNIDKNSFDELFMHRFHSRAFSIHFLL